MSYKLNKTDGSLLVELQDGVIDTTSSDITLVGRNYKGFGEYINENFIKLTESFASTSAPTNAIAGQLWYDTSDQRLKIYNGTTFRIAGGPIISSSQPNMVAGDLWIDNEQNKLYFYDGTDVVAVGPNYTATQGKTLLEAVTMIDTSGQTRAILAQYIQGNLIGIHSAAQFTPRTEDVLLPYAAGRVIKVGFNPLYTADNGDNIAFRWNGIAATAENLVDAQGVSVASTDFVRNNERDSSNVIVDQTMASERDQESNRHRDQQRDRSISASRNRSRNRDRDRTRNRSKESLRSSSLPRVTAPISAGERLQNLLGTRDSRDQTSNQSREQYRRDDRRDVPAHDADRYSYASPTSKNNPTNDRDRRRDSMNDHEALEIENTEERRERRLQRKRERREKRKAVVEEGYAYGSSKSPRNAYGVLKSPLNDYASSKSPHVAATPTASKADMSRERDRDRGRSQASSRACGSTEHPYQREEARRDSDTSHQKLMRHKMREYREELRRKRDLGNTAWDLEPGIVVDDFYEAPGREVQESRRTVRENDERSSRHQDSTRDSSPEDARRRYGRDAVTSFRNDSSGNSRDNRPRQVDRGHGRDEYDDSYENKRRRVERDPKLSDERYRDRMYADHPESTSLGNRSSYWRQDDAKLW